MTKTEAKKRREYIKDLLEASGGIWHINQRELANKYGVSAVQIHHDIKKILGDTQGKSGEILIAKLNHGFEIAILKALKSANSRDIVYVCSNYLDYMGKLGYVFDIKPDSDVDLQRFKEHVLAESKTRGVSPIIVLRELLQLPLKVDISDLTFNAHKPGPLPEPKPERKPQPREIKPEAEDIQEYAELEQITDE